MLLITSISNKSMYESVAKCFDKSEGLDLLSDPERNCGEIFGNS